MEASPLKTQLFKKHNRHTILNTEDKEQVATRPAETHERESTPCNSSTPDCLNTGSDQVESDAGIIIQMDGQDSLWDSEVDGHDSDTSTPAYKRGQHHVEQSRQPNVQGISDLEVIKIIQEEGMGFSVPDWIKTRKISPSILLLADSQVKYWPGNDAVCKVQYHQDWPISRWTQAIRLGLIKIECTTVVVYLEAVRRWSDVPPIKNSLNTLCRNIRNHGNTPWIFIANLLPAVNSSPLKDPLRTSNFNYTLQQAIRSVGRSMGRVFKLSLNEHFVSKKGRVIQPVGEYFVQSGVLTHHGCLVMRECIMRESGVKSYWFGKTGKRQRIGKRLRQMIQ